MVSTVLFTLIALPDLFQVGILVEMCQDLFMGHSVKRHGTCCGLIESDTVTITYSYQGDRYQKIVRTPAGEWEFDLPVAGDDPGARGGPVGLHLFLPGDSANSLFCNPGLLSLAVPHPLPETQWERDVKFFSPRRVDRWPDQEWLIAERRDQHVGPHSTRLNLGESTEVERNGILAVARRLDVSGLFGETHYVDHRGRVLRTDLHGGLTPLWIQLISP
jgi:hypothetical protein